MTAEEAKQLSMQDASDNKELLCLYIKAKIGIAASLKYKGIGLEFRLRYNKYAIANFYYFEVTRQVIDKIVEDLTEKGFRANFTNNVLNIHWD